MINRLIDMGKQIYFITNNSTKTRSEFVEKARSLNYNVGQENIISTGYLAAAYLKQLNFQKKVYVIGSTGISRELDLVGISNYGVGPDPMVGGIGDLKNQLKLDPEVGAVVVGFDEHISFPKMMKAATYLDKPETIFIGTNTDERFPMPDFVMPGTGSIVKAIETCAERKATIMGKPMPNSLLSNIFFNDELVKDSKRFLMIGDRLNTDILFGKNNNYQTLLVETGIHNFESVSEIIKTLENGQDVNWSIDQELENQIPDYYITKLGDLFNNFD